MCMTTVDGINPTPVDRWLIPLSKGFESSKRAGFLQSQ